MRKTFKQTLLFAILILAFPLAALSQEANAKLQEEMAKSQETAARIHEDAARLANEADPVDPDAMAKIQLAAKRAQEAADRAQAAANKSQEAANKDPNSIVAQASAISAQQHANGAQEAANRAQQTLNAASRVRPVTGSHTASKDERKPATDAAVVNVLSSASVADGAGTADSPNSAPISTSVAASAAQPDFNEFLNRRFDNLVRARLGPKNNTNQNETPSVSTNSTSLVEKSSVGDLISLALNPFGSSNSASEANPTSSAITISAYALKAFASGRDPLDPSFYTSNRHWRKLSFTYGVDYTKDKTTAAQVKSKIYGFKLLPYDKRDVSDPGNQRELRKISDLFHLTGPNAATIVSKIKRDLFEVLSEKNKLAPAIANIPNVEDRFDAFDASLAGDAIVAELSAALGGEDVFTKLVDDVIAKDIDPEVRFRKAEQEAFDAIRRNPQVAFAFFTKQREGNRPNDYVGAVTMDLGVLQRWNLTFNGMFNYVDNKLIGDNRGGTFATELQIPLNAVDQLTDRVPWTFSFAASGKWMTKEAPRFQGQAKITLPVPHMPGMELPISVSFANRKETLLGKESKVSGHVGFTFDLARMLAAFKNQLPLPLFK